MRGKRRIHAPFRAPCSSVLFSLHSARTNFARVPVPPFFFSPAPEFQGSLLSLRPLPPPLATAAAASVSSFCLVGCRQAQRHEKKESGIGPLSSRPVLRLSPARSHSVFSSVVLALTSTATFSSSSRSPCSSSCLPRRVGL